MITQCVHLSPRNPQSPSAYVRDIQEVRGVVSTHQNDPILPTGLQAPKHTANLVILEEMDGDHIDDSQSFKYIMAASQAMRTDPSNLAQA